MTTPEREKALAALAVNGGPRTRTEPWPERGHVGEEEKRAVDALFDETIATGRAFGYGGPTEEAFCRQFADFMGGGYADAVSSGSSAIYVALRSLEIEPFTEVIVSPITDPGGIMPIALLNCIPVVADAEPGRYNTGPEQVEELISPLTSAIVVAHIGGEPVDVEAIAAIGARHGVPVVEDCAQAHGATLNGRLVGSFGDVAAFSTMSGKHFNTGAQGGVVYTRDEAIHVLSRRASDRGKPHFLPEGSGNQFASLNMNLNDLAAAIGQVQLRKLPEIVERRRALVDNLTRLFDEAGLRSIGVPEQVEGAEASYWWWRLRVNDDRLDCDRDTFVGALGAEGVMLTPRYDHLPARQPWLRDRRVFGTSGYPWASPLYRGDAERQFPCPNAAEAIEDHFNLTLYESWGEAETTDIVAAIRKVESAFVR